MYVLCVLTLVAALNYFDRSILTLVLPAIKADMQLSDTVLGLVTGFAFAIFNATLGVPIARASDRWNRRNIVAAGLAFWSLMTTLTGFVANVWQLAAARFLMGAGEAAGHAPSNSMISDYFSKASRPMAVAVWATGASLGALLFSPIAGWLADAYGWRMVFIVAGAPGIALALLMVLTVKEPVRGASESAESAAAARDVGSLKESVRFLLGSRAYVFMILGGALVSASLAAAQWHATFLVRVHDLTLTEVGFIIGPVRGIVGVASVLLGGFLADRFGRIDERWRLWTPAVGCLLAGPSEILFLFAPTLPLALFGMALGSLFGAMSMGPVFAACMSVARIRMRAVAVSMALLMVGLIGHITGPLAVGYANDVLQASYGDFAIRYSLIFAAAVVTLGGASLWLAGRHLVADTKRAA